MKEELEENLRDCYVLIDDWELLKDLSHMERQRLDVELKLLQMRAIQAYKKEVDKIKI